MEIEAPLGRAMPKADCAAESRASVLVLLLLDGPETRNLCPEAVEAGETAKWCNDTVIVEEER